MASTPPALSEPGCAGRVRLGASPELAGCYRAETKASVTKPLPKGSSVSWGFGSAKQRIPPAG